MLKVAAHAHALRVHVERRLRWPRMLIIERYVVVDPVADVLHPVPAGVQISEVLKGNVAEAIHLAVAAVEQVAEHFVGKVFHRRLAR